MQVFLETERLILRQFTAADVENRIELLCLEYENLKPYLMEKWRS